VLLRDLVDLEMADHGSRAIPEPFNDEKKTTARSRWVLGKVLLRGRCAWRRRIAPKREIRSAKTAGLETHKLNLDPGPGYSGHLHSVPPPQESVIRTFESESDSYG
jgi:hypothetical protein